MHDPQIIEVENALMYYQRAIREGLLFGTSDVHKLVNMLELVLDKHAELVVAFEPEDFEEEDCFLDPDYDDEQDLDYDSFPFDGDGDHSDSRGNG